MSGDAESAVRAAFPEIDDVGDDALAEGVLRAWTTALADNAVEDLEALLWFPPEQARLDLPDETLVGHVRDVVAGCLALADALEESRGERARIDRDVLLAGALVHDVSKLYEYDGAGETELGRLLGHPHFGIHVTAAAGLPVEVQHVVLAHSHRTAVEPATLEAEIVRRVDAVAAAAIRLRAVDDLREA